MIPSTHAGDYRRTAVLTAGPEKLVVLMYEGAIRNLERAKLDLQDPAKVRSATVGECLGKAMAIIGELRAVLDFEKGGQIARDLERLYEFCLDAIYRTNVERKPEIVEGPIRVMRTLKEGWDAVVPA